MQSRLIPHDRWTEELDAFSRTHEGWIVRLAVSKPAGGSRIEARDLPLQGVSTDRGRNGGIAIMVGEEPETHLTHYVRNPVELSVRQLDDGVVSGLVVRASDGTRTAVDFRSPVRTEQVDGVSWMDSPPSTSPRHRNLVLSPPLFGFVLGTRAALAFGLGLLTAGRLREPQRKRIGLALVAFGVATTIPAARAVFSHRRNGRRHPSKIGSA